MRDLIVVGFKGTERASEVLNQLLALNADWRSTSVWKTRSPSTARTRAGCE